jgi:hypothetical protein
MITQPKPYGIHQTTYDGIFQHPIAHNLEWREIRTMLTALSDKAEEEHNGHFKFTRNGETLVVHRPKHKNLDDAQELMHIRHFLERSGEPLRMTASSGVDLLVVIDHREARVYKTEMHAAVPAKIVPYFEPNDTHRYLHIIDNVQHGLRKPESRTYYDHIAKTLDLGDRILIFGTATGASSAMDHLVVDLKQHYPAIAKRVIGSVIIDEKHTTEDQLLAKAREFYGA